MHLIKLSREKIMEIIKKLPEETITEYCARIYNAKETLGYTWDDIAYIINSELVKYPLPINAPSTYGSIGIF